MRGELFEPGGCSLTPTSPRTALRIAWPAGPGAVAVAVGASEAAAPALWSWLAKPGGGAGGVVGFAARVACPANRDCNWATRAMVTSKLMHVSHRRPAAGP